MGIWYCTRESVKTALDEAETARTNDQIDAAVAQGARDVEGLCKRPDGFAPLSATFVFDFPSRVNRSPSWRVWFDEHRAISLDTVHVDNGATLLSPADYFLEPANSGPPYDRLEIDLGSAGALSSGSTSQHAVHCAGLWGFTAERKAIGTLASTLGATAGATAAMTWTTARFGVGDVLWIDDERMSIAERTFTDSTQDLAADLDDSEAATAVSVASGTAFALEEIILIGAERMRVVDIAGNTLVVKRAWDGSQLAAHSTGADVYALTGVQLDRAVLGTTLASHATDAVVYRWVPPAPVATLNRAYALSVLLQERTGWARTIQASQDTVLEVSGRGIAKYEEDVLRLYGRRMRHRAIV